MVAYLEVFRKRTESVTKLTMQSKKDVKNEQLLVKSYGGMMNLYFPLLTPGFNMWSDDATVRLTSFYFNSSGIMDILKLFTFFLFLLIVNSRHRRAYISPRINA